MAVHRLDERDGSSGHELVCAEAVPIETDADGRIVETKTCVVVPGTDIHVHVEVLP